MAGAYEALGKRFSWFSWARAGRNESEATDLLSRPMETFGVGSGGAQRSSSSGIMYSAASGSSSTRPKLLDTRRKGDIERFGLPAGGWMVYYTDSYHTMLNMPRSRFLVVFFVVYIIQYLVFAALYLTQPDVCIGGRMTWAHSVWFSVQTAATLGYTGDLNPNPDCPGINMLVLIQVICASLQDYCLMGLVFARFSTPVNRAQTIRYSSNAVLLRQDSGFWSISFRVANIRKHSLLQPQLFLHLAVPDRLNNACFQFQDLEIDHYGTQVANLKLGLPAIISHTIKPGSALFDLSVDDMERLDLELLCFLEGVDPMTSNNLQAKHNYGASDIRMNEKFSTIDLKARRGKVGLDMSNFDSTVLATLATYHDEESDGGLLYPVGDSSHTSTLQTMKVHMTELRSKPIRDLTEAGNAVVNTALMGVPKLHAAKDESMKELCDLVLTASTLSDLELLQELKRRAAWIKDDLTCIEHAAAGKGQW